jgi:hypothetical protein
MTYRHARLIKEYKKEINMKRNIKNSSGKITGYTEINNDIIVINNHGKPILKLNDVQVLNDIQNDTLTEDVILMLYDDYTLSIGEIASIYNRCYSNINKIIKHLNTKTSKHQGRRNRAYGHKVSTEQSTKMSISLRGRQAPHYERTTEIRNKTSKSLKHYFKENPQNGNKQSNAWANGVYDNVDFKHGIAGHFTSLKTKQIIRFRSLLELCYLLQIEEDNNITSYTYEQIKIHMDNDRIYTPDLFLNNHTLIELKPKKYVERVKGVKEKVAYKKSQAIKYCNKHGYEYKIIYDEDLNFDSRSFKRYIKNNKDIVDKYHITFIHPERMV